MAGTLSLDTPPGSGRKSPRYETPPGTPPPPYVPGSGGAMTELVTWGALTSDTSHPIITMEDTDTEDEEGAQVDYRLLFPAPAPTPAPPQLPTLAPTLLPAPCSCYR